jgi:Uma2 family endonuclease
MMNSATIETIELKRHHFNVQQYHQMYEAGIFSESDRLELIYGELVTMSPINRRHAACVKRLTYLLSSRFGKKVLLSIQDPIRLSDDSEPQPDVAILKWQDDFYISGHPTASDIHWLIEVSDTTIGIDRRIKVPLYAESVIIETWLVNLNEDCLEVYRGSEELILQRGDRIASIAFPDVVFAVTDILG